MATAAIQTRAVDQIRSLYRSLSEADQLSLIVDLLQGGHPSLRRSDAFGEDLWNLDKLLTAEYQGIAGNVESRELGW